MEYPKINHPSSGPTKEERRLQSLASTYVHDATMERLAGLASRADSGNVVASNELAALSPDQRMRLGFFASARAAGVQLGLVDPATGETK